MKILLLFEVIGLCLAAILTLFASLRFSEGVRKKYPVLSIPDGNRHFFLITISIFLLVAWSSRFARDWMTSNANDEARTLVASFVAEQRQSDVPELVALSVVPSKSDYILNVKNVGKKPATKVHLIFSDRSTPSAFAGNPMPGAGEIPSGTEFDFPMNIFWGINELVKYPNSVPGFREALQASVAKFNSGEIAFIPRFYLEYYSGEKKLTSPTYYLILDKKGGAPYFGKD